MDKKTYEAPELEVIQFDAADIIVTSPGGGEIPGSGENTGGPTIP